jgi:hypothetical protein
MSDSSWVGDKLGDEWDVKGKVLKIHNEAESKDFTEDLILAKLPLPEKTFAKEMRDCAFLGKSIMNKFANGYNYKFDDIKGDWIRNKEGEAKRVALDEKKKNYIKEMGNNVFSLLMLNVNSIIELNRNVDNNHIFGHIFGQSNEPKETIGTMEPKNFLQKFKDKIGGEDEVFEED